MFAVRFALFGLLGPFITLGEISRNRVFWLLAGSFFICGLSTNGLVQTHFISLCGDNGMSAVPAASVLAMTIAAVLVMWVRPSEGSLAPMR